MSAKQAINDKLQGSVATCLRCGGVVSNQINKGLLLSLSDNFFELMNILVNLQARTWLFGALSPSFISVLAKRTKCSRQSRHVLAWNIAKYSPI